jgi:hypothetical protein
MVFALTRRHGSGISIDSVNYLSAADRSGRRGPSQGSSPAIPSPCSPAVSVSAGPGGSARRAVRRRANPRCRRLRSPRCSGCHLIRKDRRQVGLCACRRNRGPSVLCGRRRVVVRLVGCTLRPRRGCLLLVTSRIGSRRDAVIVSGLLAGVATFLRYLGVTTIPVGLLVIWLWSRTPAARYPTLSRAVDGPLVGSRLTSSSPPRSRERVILRAKAWKPPAARPLRPSARGSTPIICSSAAPPSRF